MWILKLTYVFVFLTLFLYGSAWSTVFIRGGIKTNITRNKPNERTEESNIQKRGQEWCLFSGTFPGFTESPTFKLCELKSIAAGLVAGFC